jgi:hypothetical protein
VARRLAWLLTLSLAALPAGALAQSQGDVAQARDLFQQGIEAARAERWTEARERFERSYALAERPGTLLNLAGAQAQTGQLVRAAESYRRFLAQATRGREARIAPQARRALAELEPRIAHLTVHATRAEGEVVTLDGEELPAAELDVSIPIDPGAHVLALVRGDSERDREAFTLTEGEEREVTLEPSIQIEVSPELAAASADRPSSGGGDDSGLWIGLGVGAAVVVIAAIVLGAYFGAEAANAPFQGNLGPGMISFE